MKMIWFAQDDFFTNPTYAQIIRIRNERKERKRLLSTYSTKL